MCKECRGSLARPRWFRSKGGRGEKQRGKTETRGDRSISVNQSLSCASLSSPAQNKISACTRWLPQIRQAPRFTSRNAGKITTTCYQIPFLLCYLRYSFVATYQISLPFLQKHTHTDTSTMTYITQSLFRRRKREKERRTALSLPPGARPKRKMK